jgi:hypothetical protein
MAEPSPNLWLPAATSRGSTPVSTPREGIEDVLPLFAEELLRLEGIDDDTESWEQAYNAIRIVVTLRDPEGNEVPEFLLHIDADEAWWRWSDEPFEEHS